MNYERKCVVCGKTFSTMYPAKICCSVKCARERKNMAQRIFYRREKPEAKDTAAAESPAREIARAKTGKDIMKEILKERAYVKKTKGRVCHDCGKPTNDYRCAACWEKRGKSTIFRHVEILAWKSTRIDRRTY